MKALTCEMCGSTNLLKDNGVFVCQSCGTKYSVEEAKKMMVEGTVNVKGVVQIDTSSELANLYEIARRAKDSDNVENAQKYYDMILIKDPNSWEAQFYATYYQAMQCNIAGIASAAISVSNCFPSVLKLINDTINDFEEKNNVINEIYLRCVIIAKMLYNASRNFYLDTDIEIRGNYASEHVERGIYSAGILQLLSTEIGTKFGNEFDAIQANALECSIDLYASTLLDVKPGVTERDFEIYIKDLDIIKKYNPNFNLPITKYPTQNNPSAGCYIATAVYGSYDCPEVWTLRRFRDNYLDEIVLGRVFIKLYYATSPTIVKSFGHTNWFNKIWKRTLDNFVLKLHQKGYKNTPYNDKY